MKRLNQKQQEAVRSIKGKVLVLAGAGSGKTSVIIARILYLIQEVGVDPTHILGLTFTNKAALEMQNRLAKAIGVKEAAKVVLCTFHSYCFHLLKRHISLLGYTNQFSIYDEKDIKRVLQGIVKNELSEKSPSLDQIFSMVKEKKEAEGFSKEKIEEFRSELFTSLRAYNAIDFDGLILLTKHLFEKHPEVFDSERQRFEYIMIDEYQDTNPEQHALAMMLSSYHGNLCVVGDDDQSIYGWRGASVKHILEFPYDHIIKLEQNYRSTSSILDLANEVIKNNGQRHPKTLWSKTNSENKIHIFHAPTEEEEADGVIQRIIEMQRTLNLKWSDIAILYRSNILSRVYEKKLLEAVWQKGVDWVRGIPYQIVHGTEFYERTEVKDMIAYLKCIVNPKDSESLLRIINYPRRGISTATIDALTSYNRSHKVSLWEVLTGVKKGTITSLSLSNKALQGIELISSIIEEAKIRFDREPFGQAFQWLLNVIGYKHAIESEIKSEKGQQFKWENVHMMKEMLEDYEKDNPEQSLHDFLSENMLDTDRYNRKKHGANKEALQVMTFHSAKGLEFEACFLVGLEDHILPHEKSIKDTGVEEERRLFYVALTRAKKYLTLSMSRSRKKHGKLHPSNPSRFLFELPKDRLLTSRWNFPDSFSLQ